MSASDVLKEIVKKKGGKIWVARRIGKRISYIDGLKAGEELFIPPEVIYDDGMIVVFSEGIHIDEWVKSKLEEFVSLVKKELGV